MWVQKDKLTKHLSWDEVSDWVVYALMLLTVGLTLYSGLSYLWENRKIIARL